MNIGDLDRAIAAQEANREIFSSQVAGVLQENRERRAAVERAIAEAIDDQARRAAQAALPGLDQADHVGKLLLLQRNGYDALLASMRVQRDALSTVQALAAQVEAAATERRH